jgi:hypothetical protein
LLHRKNKKFKIKEELKIFFIFHRVHALRAEYKALERIAMEKSTTMMMMTMIKNKNFSGSYLKH